MWEALRTLPRQRPSYHYDPDRANWGKAKATRWDTDTDDKVRPHLHAVPNQNQKKSMAPASSKQPSTSTLLLALPNAGWLLFPSHLPLSQTLLFYAILQGNYAGIGCPRSVNCWYRIILSLFSWQAAEFYCFTSTRLSPQTFSHSRVSGFKASSWGFKSHLCFPSIPPGNFAKSEWVMFQETPEEVNSRFPLIH